MYVEMTRPQTFDTTEKLSPNSAQLIEIPDVDHQKHHTTNNALRVSLTWQNRHCKLPPDASLAVQLVHHSANPKAFAMYFPGEGMGRVKGDFVYPTDTGSGRCFFESGLSTISVL
jgi:hypothetical protein